MPDISVKAVKVGDPIWEFDINRRIYRKDAHGRSIGSPIWREHWRETKIMGETSRSFLIGNNGWKPRKVPKSAFRNGECPVWLALSQEHIERQAWVHENCYKLAEAVGRLRDYDQLRAIAEIVGYKSAEEKVT